MTSHRSHIYIAVAMCMILLMLSANADTSNYGRSRWRDYVWDYQAPPHELADAGSDRGFEAPHTPPAHTLDTKPTYKEVRPIEPVFEVIPFADPSRPEGYRIR